MGCCLTGRLRAVVTGHAGVRDDQIVTEGGGDPGVTAVTAVTFEAGLNVFEVFAWRD